MKITSLTIPEVLIIEQSIFEDNRGFFYESFREDLFNLQTSLDVKFVQDNHSKSFQGVLRGLHYQIPPHSQGKLVRVIQGEIFDVAIDLRNNSPTFGKYTSEILSAENKKQMWIPKGFAHGHLTLSSSSEVLYKVTDFYHPASERCILWSDTSLDIKWPELPNKTISHKDRLGKSLKEAFL
jgi:dTDP-4-dehydrorhamnose 3,5-epimerase